MATAVEDALTLAPKVNSLNAMLHKSNHPEPEFVLQWRDSKLNLQ